MGPKKKDSKVQQASKSPTSATGASPSPTSAAASSNESANPSLTSPSSSSNLPLWLTEGSSQRDKNVLSESVYIYTPDGKKELIKNARVQFVYGRRYGLIGPNGAGKSTLLHHVYTYILPNFPKYLRVIYVQQHDMVEVDEEVLDWVVNSDEEKKWLESEEQRLLNELEENEEADAEQIQIQLETVTDRLAVMDARRASTRAAAILTGLGFTGPMLKSPISSLSGGWKQRVALACALFVSSDLLLLDEPTNHLDFGAVRWLEQFVKSLTQTVVIVSHDRNFLNTVSTDIIELVDCRLDYYRGDYTSYVKTRDEVQRQKRHDFDVQQKKITELKQFIEEAKKSDNPATVNLQKTRQKQLDKMELIPEPIVEKDFKFTFPDPGKLDHALVEVNDMCFKYPKTRETKDREWLIQNVNLHMDQTSRIGVLGVNGAGKSTLIKLIKGELQAQKGVCRLNPHCRVANFTQHQLDQLDLTKSTMDYLQFLFPTAKEHQIRGVMGRFGFDAKLIAQKIAELSGGQRSRVAFAILTWREPHLIIMDEPTNHLDLQTIEALIHALSNFKGGVLLVSHDQYFLQSVAKEFWAFNREGDVQVYYDLEEAKPFSYDLIDYEGGTTNREALIKQAQQAAIAEKAKKMNEAELEAAAAAGPRGKKKRRTKRGGGGVDMAELKISEALESIKAEEERKNTEIVEIQFEQKRENKEEEDENGGEEEFNDEAMEEENANNAETEAAQIEEVDEVVMDEPVKKKKSKKKSREVAEETVEDLPEEVEEPVKEKKKKKKKSPMVEDEIVEEEKIVESETKEKKKKQKKKSAELAEEDEENNLTEKLDALTLKKKKSKLKPPADGDQENEEERDGVEEKKKKKKSKTVEIADEAREEEINGEEQAEKKEKKKKKKSAPIDEEEVEVKPRKKKEKEKSRQIIEPEVDEEEVEEPKKKEKKKSKLKQSREDLDEQNEEGEEEISEKKKKKKKSSEIVEEEENEQGGKKKKKSKSQQKDAEDRDKEEVEEKNKKEKKKSKSRNDDDEDVEEVKEKTKKKSKKQQRDEEGKEDEAAEEEPKAKKKSGQSKSKSPTHAASDE